jgi:2-oxoglutarate ferredoxin oxidoreductase subunit alpha
MNYSGQVAQEVRRVLGGRLPVGQANRWDGQVLTPQQILATLRDEPGRGVRP